MGSEEEDISGKTSKLCLGVVVDGINQEGREE